MRTLHDPSTCAHGADDRRRGTIMVVFALLVFALMGLAAIAIDVGLASLTQSQMQTAVDTAALEGVQHRDFHDYREKSNEFRRPRASELVRHVFDDDFHPTAGVAQTSERPLLPSDDADAGRFGAGPVLTLTPSTVLDVPGASQTLSVPGVPVLDDPVLQINYPSDLVHGDMLSGVYVPDAGHDESSEYVRSDFERAANPIASRMALGFLVRMRRTNGDGPNDAVAGVSSRGPTVPLLFGLGAAIVPADGSSSNPRLEGLTVRACAIAAARPALAVGPVPLHANGLPFLNRALPSNPHLIVRGLAPVALERQFWTAELEYTSSGTGVQEVVDLADGDGDGLIDLMHDGAIVGRSVAGGAPSACTSVGRPVVSTVLAVPRYYIPGNDYETYFPIYEAIESDDGGFVERVVGYGYGKFIYEPTMPDQLTLTKGISVLDEPSGLPGEPPCNVIVAADNASAHLSSVVLDGLDLSSDEWERVFSAHVAFARRDGIPVSENLVPYRWQDIRPGTLLAPALVR